MFSQYFGHYLLNKDIISAEQLKEALHVQASTHVKLGVLSINEGFMTAAQVEEVHDKQKQVDKRFGEIAIELGYLSESQLQQLLSNQKQNHLILSQALVDLGYMSIEQVSNALHNYKQEFSLSDEQFEAIKNDDIDTIIQTVVNIDHPSKEYYFDYLSLFAKNLIRFIDDQVRLEAQTINEEYKCPLFVKQLINGKQSFITGIGCTKDAFLPFASAYAEETIKEMNELAKASVSEFLNFHNGIYLVNMSNNGTELNMEPQQFQENIVIPTNCIELAVKAHLSFGTIDLIIYQP